MDTRLNYCIANDIFEAAAKLDRPRNYLGMSEVGHPCDRFIWFRFRQFTKIPTEPRMYFLFRFGDKIEELVCTYLRSAGYKLEHAWPDQQASFSGLNGILRGHSDGIIYLPDGPALLECKSANKKKFQAFVLGGVKATNVKYYWQAQLYMGFSGLRRAMFVIINKDDSNIHTEIVPFNQVEFDSILKRVAAVVTSPTWPEMKDLPDCEYCEYRLHCKTDEGKQLSHSCMSCNFLKVSTSGHPFSCRHQSHVLPLHHVEMTCPEYSWVGGIPF